MLHLRHASFRDEKLAPKALTSEQSEALAFTDEFIFNHHADGSLRSRRAKNLDRAEDAVRFMTEPSNGLRTSVFASRLATQISRSRR